jgi:hypothetical protein
MMTPKKPKTGVLHDPWRTSLAAPDAPKPKRVPTPSTDNSPINDDLRDTQYATIALKGYGGITIEGVTELKHAAAQLLKFCVDQEKLVDDILVQFGVLLAQMPVGNLKTKFFIQRADGWLIAVPEAKTRDEGCLQLIQAMVKIDQSPPLHLLLRKYHIRPYKM